MGELRNFDTGQNVSFVFGDKQDAGQIRAVDAIAGQQHLKHLTIYNEGKGRNTRTYLYNDNPTIKLIA